MQGSTRTRSKRYGRKPLLLIAILALMAMLVPAAVADHDVSATGPQFDADVHPTFIAGNPTCGDFGGDLVERKIEPVSSGTHTIGDFSVELDVYNINREGWRGQVFDFEILSNHVAGTVVVKGGPNANLYDYAGLHSIHAPMDPGDGFTVTEDDTLHAPHNSNNRFYGLSHISFCVEEAPEHSLLVEKVDHEDEPLAGAEFALYEEEAGTTHVGDLAVVHDHLHCIDGLEPGTYWVHEEVTPVDFEESGPFEVTTSSEETCAERVDENGLIDGADGPDLTVVNEPEPVDLTVTKYKLTLDAEGNLVRSETTLEGFEYTLYAGGLDADGNPTDAPIGDAVTTDEFGEALFENLEVGETYSVCETGRADPEDYWSEADPLCQEFTTDVGTDVSLDFENEPLSRVQILFFDETGFTNASIACVDEAGEPVGDPITVTGADEAEELDHLALGDYDCTIEIRNGGNGTD